MTITLTIPLVPPSLNTLLRLGRRISAKQKISRDLWVACICALHQQSGMVRPPLALEPRRVKITMIRRRLIDMDNAIGGAKPLLDVLVKTGLLMDDRPSALIGGGAEYHQELAKGRSPMTRIEISWPNEKEECPCLTATP
jgi:hypothetical protein